MILPARESHLKREALQLPRTWRKAIPPSTCSRKPTRETSTSSPSVRGDARSSSGCCWDRSPTESCASPVPLLSGEVLLEAPRLPGAESTTLDGVVIGLRKIRSAILGRRGPDVGDLERARF